MCNAWVSDINYVASYYGASVIVGTETVPKMIGDNLLNRATYLFWRPNSTTDSFTIDLGQNRLIDVVSLISRRYTDPYLRFETPFFSSADTYRLYFDADGGTPGTGAVHDTGTRNFGMQVSYGYEPYLFEWDAIAASNVRYIHCEISTPSRTSLGYFDLSYVWAGKIFRPTVNFLIGDEVASDDLSSKEEAPISGVLFTDVAEKLREWEFTFNRLTPDERRLQEISQHWLGTSGVFLAGRASEEDLDIYSNVMMASHKQISGIVNAAVETSSKRFKIRETR